jgi:uncharacterized repeat protein (TIGR01451 family)
MPRFSTGARSLLALLCALVVQSCAESAPTNPTLQPGGPRFAGGGGVGVNLDQCANAPRTANCTWQNGDLNGNNSTYAEGLAVPFRLEFDGLPTGTHTIHLNYDFTAGGHEGYDFLADFDLTEKVDLCAVGGGGRSALCDTFQGGLTKANATSLFAFPSDPFPVPGANNLTVAGAELTGLFGANGKRHLYAWGATITAISAITHAGPTTGNNSADLVVTFTNTGANVAFAWSAHLAQSSYWKNSDGTADGAGQISGAPWHMRTQQLDNSGNKNQDRSIQPSAIINPPLVTLTKTADAASVNAGSQIGFTITAANPSGAGAASAFVLTDTLPAGTGITWTIASQSGPITCAIVAGQLGEQILTCPSTGTGTLGAGQTLTVHVTSPTTSASCGTYNNTAHVTFDPSTGGAPPDPAQASTTVNCADVHIAKTADASSVSAGDQIGFTITVNNAGGGGATGVAITDTLPSGLTWAIDAANTTAPNCSITSGILTCNVGTLAPAASVKVHVTATTSASNCGTVPNTAHFTTTNDGSGQASASVTVNCPNLTIVKTPDKTGDAGYTVQEGGTATFTITVSNTGAGNAYTVLLTDPLPGGTLTWTPDQGVCSVSSNTLTCNIGTLAPNGSFTVHVSAPIPSGFTQVPPTQASGTVEIDGNLISNGGLDWANVGISCLTLTGCDIDKPTGSSDDSFGQGTSEDDGVPTVVSGSIPNNKSDLLRFYVTNNHFGADDFLYLAWERVQAPNGTTNMDFELNQSSTLSANGVTPVRTAGDILIKYDLAKGGTHPTISFSKWLAGGGSASSLCEANNSFPCWSKAVSVSGALAAIDTVPATDPLLASGQSTSRTLDPLTFGEASIDLQAAGIFQAGACVNFGSAYLKSRSSTSFTSEIKDFIKPISINLTNCVDAALLNTATVTATNVTGSKSDSGAIEVKAP